MWSIPDTNNAHISSYEVAVFPSITLPASGVIAGDTPLFQTRQLTLTLQHGQQYYITVRAKSCNDTVEGAVSPALLVNIKGYSNSCAFIKFYTSCFISVPPKVVRCTALPVYDFHSKNLTRIEIIWSPIHVGHTLKIMSYVITAPSL